MDLTLGMTNYRKFLDPLSSVAHHTFYIGLVTFYLTNRFSRGFMLGLVMEIPTFVLALGSVWKCYRSDLLFGVAFLLTRLVYNIYLARQLAVILVDGVVWKICVGVLGLHIYWFYKWCKLYQKTLQVSKSVPAYE
eukprot:gene29790-36890_t